ncbi:MAG: hypothetical protein JWL99_493, partial [Streptomyces oryziradicis]|nr:hypothetical protein [Actinacidiphila oryziradicis]
MLKLTVVSGSSGTTHLGPGVSIDTVDLLVQAAGVRPPGPV